MNDKRTPMEAEVQELSPMRACPEDFYGTAEKPKPRRSYAWFWICTGLVVIAVCSFSVVAALFHLELENRNGSWRLALKSTEQTKTEEDPVRKLDVPDDNRYVPARGENGETVRLPLAAASGETLTAEAIYALVSPAVVCVQVETYYGSAISTGVVVSEDGYILTAAEDLSTAFGITVSFSDGTVRSARRIGEDRTSGVCLLKADAQSLQTVSFSNGSELSVGQRVYCVCNPYGTQLPNVFYEGMLSAFRGLDVRGTVYTLLQASVQLRSLGFGCPILDSRGRVLGLTSPIGRYVVAGEDPCFAVSAQDLERIVTEFESSLSADSRWLGLEVSDIPEDYLMLYGYPGSVWIDEIAVGSAPYGVLMPYDVITAVDDTPVASAEEFNLAVCSREAGERIMLTIYRSGKWYTILLPVLAR